MAWGLLSGFRRYMAPQATYARRRRKDLRRRGQRRKGRERRGEFVVRRSELPDALFLLESFTEPIDRFRAAVRE